MARTFINPSTQIGKSTEYDDTLPASADLQNNAETLQDDLNALRSMVKKAVGKASWYEAPTADLESVNTAVGTAQSDITALETDVGTLQTDVSSQGQSIATLQTDLDAAEGSIAILQANVSTLTEEQGNLGITVAGLVTGLVTTDANVSGLDARLGVAEGEIDTLQSEMATAQSSIATLQTDMSAAQGAISTLQTDLDTAEGNISTLQSDVATAQGDISTIQLDLSTLSGNAILKDGSVAFTASQSMGNNSLTNLAAPTSASDAATKAYVDSLVTGLKLHEPVRARMDVVNGTFAGSIADGVQLETGDRVFAVDSQNATNSGIYVATIFNETAVFARAADFAAGDDVDGAFFFCQQGDTYADTSWVQTSSNLVGQGPLSFSMMFSPGDYQAGAGLDLVNKVFSVEPEGIVNSMLASSSVSEGKIADLAVSESKIAAASVSTGKIANLAVTEGKIAAASVTQAKLALVAPVANLDAATKLYVDERGFGSKVRLVVEGGLYASLQAAVDAAVANDVILVGPKASGDWGNVSFPTDKRLAVSALAGTQEQKIVKIGTVTFDTSGGAGNVNNNEVYLSGLHITGSFSTQAVLFQGTAPARLRMSNCYVYNLGSGDGIVNNNNAANSSLYLDSVLAQSSSVTGTVLKHTKGYTFVKNRSMFEGGLYAASCAAGVLEVYDSSFSMSGAREAVLVSGTGLMTLGYSTIQNTNTGASAIGVNVSSATASFGAGDSTISVGGLAGAAGKAVSGSGYYSFGSVTYGFATAIEASVIQRPAARTGGTFTTALSMSSNKITSLAAPTADTDAANKQYVDDQAALKLSLSGGTMSGALAMGGKAITGVLDPVNAQDAVTKAYVDALDARGGKSFAEVTVNIPKETLVAYSSQNINAELPVMPSDESQFNRQFDVYVNGQLLRPGSGFDVVRSQNNAKGLVLGMPLYTGDTLCIVSYT